MADGFDAASDAAAEQASGDLPRSEQPGSDQPAAVDDQPRASGAGIDTPERETDAKSPSLDSILDEGMAELDGEADFDRLLAEGAN